MITLNKCELFSTKMASSITNNINNAVTQQLSRNIGVISPKLIEVELSQLKKNTRKTSIQSLAINLYESFDGRIRLFNLATNSGRVTIPPYIPFIIAGGVPSPSDPNRKVSAIFMNMYNMGSWNADDSDYLKLDAHKDLYSVLETAGIMYNLALSSNNGKETLLNNPQFLQTLTRIYKTLFTKAVSKATGTTYGRDDFQRDLGNFIIARFFLKYVLEKNDSLSVDQIAHVAIKPKSSLSALQMDANYREIDYTTLSGFLKTFGKEMIHDEVSLSEFTRAWTGLYGVGTLLCPEYVPHLLHFLFATLRGSDLGKSSKLGLLRSHLAEDGLDTLYKKTIEILG